MSQDTGESESVPRKDSESHRSEESASSADDPRKELRIGLVLYGGVSLAVYIFGVVYEFLRLVRYKGTAYEALLDPLHVTPRIDVVSGSSAGGINGLILAKALSTGASMEGLKELWIRKGDAEALIDGHGPRDVTKSLFDTEYYVHELEEAFLATKPSDGVPIDSPLMDAFITVTDLEGMIRSFPGLGGLEAKQFCQTFHLKARPSDYLETLQSGLRDKLDLNEGIRLELQADGSPGRNDFIHQDRLLARIAGATSAFPVAFEPAQFEKGAIDRFVRFRDADEARSQLVFADGGMVDNKPFSYTIKTIFTRQASRPVDRKLVYIEPDPSSEIRTTRTAPSGVPRSLDGLDSLLRFLSAKLGESIGNDLDEVQERNERITRVRNMLDQLEESLTAEIESFRENHSLSEFRDWVRRQSMHRAYDDLKKKLLVELFVARVKASKPSGMSDGDIESAFRQEAQSDKFLRIYDYPFRIRRLRYFIRKVNQALQLKHQNPRVSSQLCELKTLLYVFVEFYENGAWRAIERSQTLVELRNAFQRLMTSSHSLMMAQLAAWMVTLRDVDSIGFPKWLTTGMSDDRDPDRSEIDFFSDAYELIDMYLYPATVLADVGEADPIEVVRISPADDPEFGPDNFLDKIAGEKLGHFSAFLKQSWRENDILWGRLDAAERIINRILRPEKDPPTPELQALFDRTLEKVRNEIIEEELSTILDRRKGQLAGAVTSDNRPSGIFDEAYQTIRDRVAEGKGLIDLLLNDYSVGQERLSAVDQAYLWRTSAKATRALGDLFRDHQSPQWLRKPISLLRFVLLLPYSIAVSLGGAERSRRLQLRNFGMGLIAVVVLAHLFGILAIKEAGVWVAILLGGVWYLSGLYDVLLILLAGSFLLMLLSLTGMAPPEGALWNLVAEVAGSTALLALGAATLLGWLLRPRVKALLRWLNLKSKEWLPGR